jgi:hypothetical protein
MVVVREVTSVPGLLQQLAGAGDDRVFLRVDQAPGDLQAVPARPRPELADEQDLLLRRDRDRVDGVGQVDDVEVVGQPRRARAEPLLAEREQPVLLHRPVVLAAVDAGPRRGFHVLGAHGEDSGRRGRK